MVQAKIGGYNPSNPLDWEGTNIQAVATIQPTEEEREMVLELYCVKCQTKRLFTVTAELGDFFVRKTKAVDYGSTCMICGNKVRMRLDWSKTPSWKHFKKDEKGDIIPK